MSCTSLHTKLHINYQHTFLNVTSSLTSDVQTASVSWRICFTATTFLITQTVCECDAPECPDELRSGNHWRQTQPILQYFPFVPLWSSHPTVYKMPAVWASAVQWLNLGSRNSTWSREQEAGIAQKVGRREQGAGSREQGAGSREQEVGSRRSRERKAGIQPIPIL